MKHEILNRQREYLGGDTYAFSSNYSCGETFTGWSEEECESKVVSHLYNVSKKEIKPKNNLDFVFKESSSTGKTKIYHIYSTHSEDYLGKIFWHGAWRQYVAESQEGIIWSSGCLEELAKFLKEINKEHKKK